MKALCSGVLALGMFLVPLSSLMAEGIGVGVGPVGVQIGGDHNRDRMREHRSITVDHPPQ